MSPVAPKALVEYVPNGVPGVNVKAPSTEPGGMLAE
jgi:hypothetical protein